jgi:hypothetical protein
MTSKRIRILKIKYIIIFIILVAGSGCGSSTKGKSHYKIRKSSCSLDQLVGNDTFYYSDRYQRKLKRSRSNRTLLH